MILLRTLYKVQQLNVLINEEEPSEDDGTNGVSKEDSSSPNGVDKDLQNNSKGNKNANSPIILNKANKMFEEVASTSNSQIVIDEANEESKEEAQESPFLQNKANGVLGSTILLQTLYKFRQLNIRMVFLC
ncbi:hypothetical protein GH714_002262 [Hevea brasiliensis]|uniref:Uncharacterized protein n=1 Tax=Hevea brasiliensis TaxID=3981 RepID=A0A6A6KZU8_HEVBR|nr:hypothetical protein GH714_002262 [Hevea brasiliensis]